MEGVFRAARLESRGADRAYALVQFLDPTLKREDWVAFLAAAGGGADVMAIEDARGYAHAVFVQRVEQDLRYGRVLRLTALACSGLPSPDLHEAIFASGDRIARERGCSGVLIELAEPAQPFSCEVAGRGLETSVSSRFAKSSAAYYRPLPRGDA